MARDVDGEKLVTELLETAARAANAIMRVYGTDFGVDYKTENDPVTVADREANGIICDAIRRSFPGIPVVAEESDPTTYSSYASADAAFFVDPLDGTRDFVKRNGEFVVMIGFAVAGRAKYGIIHAPASGRAFAGGEDVPSFEAAAGGHGELSRKPIRVSTTSDMKAARLVISRSRPSATLYEVARTFGIAEVTELGSAGLKALRVAQGDCEFYAHAGRAGSRWDACAPEAIARGAGGVTTDLDGNPIDYRAPSLENAQGILCSNGLLHETMLEAVRKVTAEMKAAKNGDG